MGKHRLKMF